MEGITNLLDVLGSALDSLANLGHVDGASRALRGNPRDLITNLPPLPIPPVKAAPQQQQIR